jgi:hypothetical protein
MKPNPGGQLDAKDIIGRDDLVRGMWEVLEGRSIYMNDLRRIGKTQILNRMEALVPQGDREKLLELLKLLLQDHYLTRNEEGHYAFRLALIRRWWRFDRCLGGA